MNIISHTNEKTGGNPLDSNQIQFIFYAFAISNLTDLGYEATVETWSNNHQGKTYIRAMLDMFLASVGRFKMFPHYQNNHLPNSKTDHNLLLLVFQQDLVHHNNRKNIEKPKRFENIWMDNHDIHNIIKTIWQQNHH